MSVLAPCRVAPEVLWAQRRNKLFVTINIQDCPNKDYILDILPTHILFQGTNVNTNKDYHLNLKLFGEINHVEYDQTLSDRFIQMCFTKKLINEKYWPRLLEMKGKAHNIKTDFNKWKDEPSPKKHAIGISDDSDNDESTEIDSEYSDQTKDSDQSSEDLDQTDDSDESNDSDDSKDSEDDAPEEEDTSESDNDQAQALENEDEIERYLQQQFGHDGEAAAIRTSLKHNKKRNKKKGKVEGVEEAPTCQEPGGCCPHINCYPELGPVEQESTPDPEIKYYEDDFDEITICEVSNHYGAVIDFEGVETYSPPGMMNRFSKPGKHPNLIAKIPEITKYNNDTGEHEPLSKRQLNKICHRDNKISFYNQRFKKTYRRKNGFTVRQLFDAIAEYEQVARPRTDWFGGIDVHHRFFEGLVRISGNNCFHIVWGS